MVPWFGTRNRLNSERDGVSRLPFPRKTCPVMAANGFDYSTLRCPEEALNRVVMDDVAKKE